jgi:Putative capsular polysaccharide synthesis protein
MLESASNSIRPQRSAWPLLRARLKRAANRHPLLLATIHSVRRFLAPNKPSAPRKPAVFDPLHPDQKMLAEFASVSPELRDEMMHEFLDLARVLKGVRSGLSANFQCLAEHSLDNLLAWSADLNVVYTPGKVGSGTIHATLSQHPYFQSPVRHVHFLSLKGLAFVEQLINQCASRPAAHAKWNDTAFWGYWIRIQIAINRALRARNRSLGTSVRKPYVVAGVREPVAIHLSWCFEVSWMYGDNYDNLTADFVHQRFTDDGWHRHCDNWFTNDLAKMFGVDVYSRRFPTERGWDIYENDAARVLLIRQENFAELPNALGALYGLDPSTFKVATSNTAEGKDYAARYATVKKELRLCSQELEEIYSLPYVRHFYTPTEIAAFKSRWQATETIRNAA